MGWIKDLLEKVKKYLNKVKKHFNKDNSPSTSKPTIEIRGRHDSQPTLQTRSATDSLRITIGEAHRRPSTAEGTVDYGSELDVQHRNRNVGRGITVKKQRKPRKCPLCATYGKVVANTGRGDRWRCEDCGLTFN